MKLILASASPRRAELLASAGLTFRVLVSAVPEVWEPSETPEEYVRRNATAKALAICQRHGSDVEGALVIGADTIVVSPDGRILEKPADAADARRMLTALSGSEHRVCTSYAICNGTTGYVLVSEVVTTIVSFRDCGEDEIERYVSSGEPMDKAGAYGIQGGAAGFVDSLVGSYTNVVGLPLSHVLRSLRDLHAGEAYSPRAVID